MVQTAAKWSDWAGILVTRHIDLVSGRSAVRDMVDMDSPQAYSPNMLPAKDCKFDKDVTLVGLPPPTLWPPADDLVFAALCEQDDYWMFLRDTQDDRKMELYEAYGIVLSALLSKMC